MTAARLWSAALATCVLLASGLASGQAAPPAGHEDAAFDVMNLLARKGLHDLDNERWNLYGQVTYISNWKLPFDAAYTNLNGSTNSLVPGYEYSFTVSSTLFFGLATWHGGEVYLVPEVISEHPLSGLHGLGGAIQNFELQKTGNETPHLYMARMFLRQTLGLGGERVVETSNPMQLGTTVERRRVVLTAGNFSILDVFDKNAVTGDPRQTFLDMAFMTHAAWDFPSNARGYSWGGTAELYWDDWALRVGRITPPKNPNQLAVDFRIWKYYGDQLELEHDHTVWGQPGAVRVLGYRNHVFTGAFGDAIAAWQTDASKNAAACPDTVFHYDSTNASAPDLCWARRPNVKLGIGLNLEQMIARDIGVFFRAMVSDGRTEVDAYNAADRSLSLGGVVRGARWHRPFDLTGMGFATSWISAAHARYLRLGGIDGFIGDGGLAQAAEGVVEAFYSANLGKAIWVTIDYQMLWNPGYNADRAGPVYIPGARLHAEF